MNRCIYCLQETSNWSAEHVKPRSLGTFEPNASTLQEHCCLTDPKRPDHNARLEWIGGAFDPEKFDLAATNAKLQRFKL